MNSKKQFYTGMVIAILNIPCRIPAWEDYLFSDGAAPRFSLRPGISPGSSFLSIRYKYKNF